MSKLSFPRPSRDSRITKMAPSTAISPIGMLT